VCGCLRTCFAAEYLYLKQRKFDRMVSQLRHEGIRNYGNEVGRVSNEGCDMDGTRGVAITSSECPHEISPGVACEQYISTYCDMFVVASCVLLKYIRQ